MSQEVELTIDDYHNILNCYERAFAKQNNPSQQERNTFIKLSAMVLSKTQQMKEDAEEESKQNISL